MPEQFYNMPWVKQLEAAKYVSGVQPLQDKIKYIHSLTGDQGLFEVLPVPVVDEDGKEYRYGLDPRNWDIAASNVLVFLLGIDNQEWYKLEYSDFQRRLDACSDNYEKRLLIKEEIASIREKMEYNKASNDPLCRAEFYGYQGKKRKRRPEFEMEYFSRQYCSRVSCGQVAWLIELYLLKALEDVDITEEPIDESNTKKVSGPRGKLVLLHAVGLLQPLREKYSKLSDADFGKLLCLITGEESFKQFAKEYEAILYYRPVSGKGGSPINKQSVNTVKGKLASIGISAENLPDFDD